MIYLLKNKQNRGKKLVALIDGEHYPDVTYDALKILRESFSGNFVGIIFLGGTEKLVIDDLKSFFGTRVYKIEDIDVDFIKALHLFKPDLVYDLSDEPVVNYTIRMKIASYCFANGASYMGPDFFFKYEKRDSVVEIPCIEIIGTGKRIGKTAISAFISNMFSTDGIKVCIVAMGRGGPPKPQILEGDKIDITPQFLLKLSNSGLHASSDYVEDALMSKVITVGCRRCGGGFGGKVFLSNVKEGVIMAKKLNPDVILLEGSGASLPDVKADASICVVGAYQSWDDIVGYLGIYRIMISDLIIMTMCEEPMAKNSHITFLEEKINKINPGAGIFKSIFRPVPLSDISGKKIFMVMTAREEIKLKIKDYMEKKYNCEIKKISFNLSNRKTLKKDLEQFDNYDTILTELKAASVDVVTASGLNNKRDIVYMNNVPFFFEGEENIRNGLKKICNKAKIKCN